MRDDRDHMAVKGVSLEVRAGEIVALAGVQGNGQTELVEAIVGLRPVDSGEIVIDGHTTTSASPRHVSDLGVAHVPEDRMRDGLIGAMTVAENFILDTYHREPYSKRGQPQRQGHRGARGDRGQGLRRPDAVHRHLRRVALGRQPAEGRRRPRVLPARQAGRRRRSRPVASTSGPSSTSTSGWSSSAMPVPPSSSSAPSWTRSWRSETGWPSCWEARSWASWRARRPPTRRSAC